MANATAITVNALTANGDIDAPTAQVLDTGTAAVALETPDEPHLSRCFMEVTNLAAAALTVKISAGDTNPPAFRKGAVGDYTSGNIAQNGRKIFGPFESGRFRESTGKLKATFTPASGTINATFVFYRMPRV